MTNEESLEIITNARQTQITTVEQDKALAIAQKALEKQIPKKPIINKRKIQCVNGHNQPTQHYKYCPMCGQLMDWSDKK